MAVVGDQGRGVMAKAAEVVPEVAISKDPAEVGRGGVWGRAEDRVAAVRAVAPDQSVVAAVDNSEEAAASREAVRAVADVAEMTVPA